MSKYELIIEHEGTLLFPAVEGSVTLTLTRQIVPGTLEFSVINSKDLTIAEGNPVRFKVDGKPIFYGFVFNISGDDDLLKIRAYDQIRYLKNKDTMVYKGITAAGLLKKICKEYNLKWGDVEDTKYPIPPRIEDNQTLADMLKNALDLTLQNANKLYVLYDDFGKLTLKDIENMRLNLLYDAETMGGFSFSSSIDSGTYNKVKLSRVNEETGYRDIYIAQDSGNINKWGLLQHYEELKEGENGKVKANALLKLLNRRTRQFKANNVMGDLSVKAGSSFAIQARIGAENILSYFIVDSVKHSFDDHEHFMDLDLRGGV